MSKIMAGAGKCKLYYLLRESARIPGNALWRNAKWLTREHTRVAFKHLASTFRRAQSPSQKNLHREASVFLYSVLNSALYCTQAEIVGLCVFFVHNRISDNVSLLYEVQSAYAHSAIPLVHEAVLSVDQELKRLT